MYASYMPRNKPIQVDDLRKPRTAPKRAEDGRKRSTLSLLIEALQGEPAGSCRVIRKAYLQSWKSLPNLRMAIYCAARKHGLRFQTYLCQAQPELDVEAGDLCVQKVAPPRTRTRKPDQAA